MPQSFNPYRSKWTDEPLASGPAPYANKIRKKHVDELREAINKDITDRGGSSQTFVETITESVTPVRASHLNELRTATTALSATLNPCATNTTAVVFTDPSPMVHDTNNVRAVHIQELRNIISTIEAQCYCDCVGHCSCVSHSNCGCNCASQGCGGHCI